MLYTINQIQSEMTAAGSHWWDRDSMQFFNCRVGDQVYQGPGGIYFVTSEKSGSNGRAYTVRSYHPCDKSIDTVGQFNSMTRSQAHREAAKLASTPLDDQLAVAIAALDIAVTGKSKSGYGSHADARNRVAIYLSDGGYTRVVAYDYDGYNGYYLKVVPTFSTEEANEAVRAKFSAAYDLQQEVTVVLKREPAGESATVTKEICVTPTAAEQLAIDIQRNGGRCNNSQADYLIRLANAHHQMMVDYCNGMEPLYREDDEPTTRYADLISLINEAASSCGCGVVLKGDPRGATVKLVMPNGATNDWGKEGWCVPTQD
jgi:hypothetical protein